MIINCAAVFFCYISSMDAIADDTGSFSPRLVAGFAAAVLVHVALLVSFPALTSITVLDAALTSGATVLRISVLPKEARFESKPVVQAPSKMQPAPVIKKRVTPAVKKTARPKPLPKTAASAPPIAQAAPIAPTSPKVIPLTTQVSLHGKRVSPIYPKRALRMRQEGTVMLKVLVDKQGDQKEIQVSRSSRFPMLDRAALEAVKQWRFRSTMQDGTTILSWVQVPVEFRIR